MNIKTAIANQKSTLAFSLIELLVVIAIIAVIAAILLPVGAAIALKSHIQSAQAEEKALETAIDTYHAKFGFYPPSNANSSLVLTNQLYYELLGTTNNPSVSPPTFTTLDNSSTIGTNVAVEYFGVPAFMNCTTGSGEDKRPALTFLSSLKPGQIGTNLDGVCVITTAVMSDAIYRPMGTSYSTRAGRTANPWRYLYPGVNNPNSYDLWLQLFVGGKTNLICNWKTTPQLNAPQP
jgi:prepilin-type N-terminal cleavage/methylation domain-containing protein